MNHFITILSSAGVLSLRFSAPAVSGSSSFATVADSHLFVKCFCLTSMPFLFGFSPCKTTKTGSRARIVGFCQFQNLSIGKMHKVFLHPSGASALNFHAQKSAEKNFVSKEPRKSAFLHRRFRSRSAEKTCAMLVLPSGEAPNRTERRHDEPNDVKRGDADSSGHG